MVFSPFGGLIGEPRDPFLAMAVAIAYLPMALALLLATRRDRSSLAWQACVGVGVDIVVAALITYAVPGADPGVAMMLLFNFGAAALLLPLPLAMSVAPAAAAAVVGDYLWHKLDGAVAAQLGRASCRESVCPSGCLSVVAVSSIKITTSNY